MLLPTEFKRYAKNLLWLINICEIVEVLLCPSPYHHPLYMILDHLGARCRALLLGEYIIRKMETFASFFSPLFVLDLTIAYKHP